MHKMLFLCRLGKGTMQGLFVSPLLVRMTSGQCRLWSGCKATHLSGVVPIACYRLLSTSAANPDASQNAIKKKIRSLQTVKEQLELFDTLKNSLDMINKVTVLHTVANTVWRDGNQRIGLQNIRASSPKGHSRFKDLLNNIADHLPTSNLDCFYLGRIIWSLEKIQETNHRLYQICSDKMKLQC